MKVKRKIGKKEIGKKEVGKKKDSGIGEKTGNQGKCHENDYDIHGSRRRECLMVMEYADMHCDTISRLYIERKNGSAEDLYGNKGHVDLGRLKKGELCFRILHCLSIWGRRKILWKKLCRWRICIMKN